MSELTSYNSERIYWAVEQVEREAGDIDDLHLDDNLFYLKSKADKVIADLEDKLHNVSGILKETREWLIESQKLHKRCADNAVKVIRRQKYKRCLAMARWCESERYKYPDAYGLISYKGLWLEKWHNRWLELAEKFKPNKEAK